jgi:hypothetical protein
MNNSMDHKKAQRLLNKIEALLDNGNSQNLSRLEKDLLKSYIVQLYEIATDEEVVTKEKEQTIPEYTVPKKEPAPKVEMPPAREPEIHKSETSFPKYQEPLPLKEKQVEVDIPVQETKRTPIETKAPQFQIPEPVRETKKVTSSPQPSGDINENLVKLFDLPKTDEMSGRFSHVPIASIESAMGLNERIFTLKELFGGDKDLFDSVCSKLNQLHSYAEARTMLMNGPARDFRWADPERIKMAEQFIRIVTRRYPKSVS